PPRGGRGAGDDGERGEGLRSPEGALRALPRRRVRGRLPAQGAARGAGARRARRGDRGRDRGRRTHGAHRRREDLHHGGGGGRPHPHRRARTGRRVTRKKENEGMGATSAQGWYLFTFIVGFTLAPAGRSEEHTSELQS